jgi:hypothetical protein
MSAQLHRSVNKLCTISILMAQYDKRNRRAWSLVGRIASDIRSELLGTLPSALPVIGDQALYLTMNANQRQQAPEAPARVASHDKRQIHDMRRSGT